MTDIEEDESDEITPEDALRAVCVACIENDGIEPEGLRGVLEAIGGFEHIYDTAQAHIEALALAEEDDSEDDSEEG